MNTPLKTRIARIASSIVASVLITFTVVNLIANYALPDPASSGATDLAATAASSTR